MPAVFKRNWCVLTIGGITVMAPLKQHLLEKKELMKQIELLEAENCQLKQQYIQTAGKLKWFKQECKRLKQLICN